MSCPGLHCPGCSGGQSLAVAGGTVLGLALACETVQWVAHRIWWIGGTLAVCFALAVAAGIWLERWNDRRAARWGAARGIWSRADVILPPPARAAGIEPGPRRAAITPQVVNFNFYGADATRAAALIHQALPGTTGDPDTAGEQPWKP